MDGFVHRQNLERLRKLRAETSDDAQRRQIVKLLAEEEAQDLQLRGQK
jgi:predicted secreted protein